MQVYTHRSMDHNKADANCSLKHVAEQSKCKFVQLLKHRTMKIVGELKYGLGLTSALDGSEWPS
jgi:hypothetical protein